MTDSKGRFRGRPEDYSYIGSNISLIIIAVGVTGILLGILGMAGVFK